MGKINFINSIRVNHLAIFAAFFVLAFGHVVSESYAQDRKGLLGNGFYVGGEISLESIDYDIRTGYDDIGYTAGAYAGFGTLLRKLPVGKIPSWMNEVYVGGELAIRGATFEDEQIVETLAIDAVDPDGPPDSDPDTDIGEAYTSENDLRIVSTYDVTETFGLDFAADVGYMVDPTWLAFFRLGGNYADLESRTQRTLLMGATNTVRGTVATSANLVANRQTYIDAALAKARADQQTLVDADNAGSAAASAELTRINDVTYEADEEVSLIVGVGTEKFIAQHFSVRGVYLYNLGGDREAHIFRAGISYRF